MPYCSKNCNAALPLRIPRVSGGDSLSMSDFVFCLCSGCQGPSQLGMNNYSIMRAPQAPKDAIASTTYIYTHSMKDGDRGLNPASNCKFSS